MIYLRLSVCICGFTKNQKENFRKTNLLPVIPFLFHFFFLLLFSTTVYAIEGNEPEAGIDLLSPEVKFKTIPEETLKLPVSEKSYLSLYSQLGNTNTGGEEYEVILTKKALNYAVSGKGIKIEDRIAVGSEIEARTIGNFNISELNMKLGGYKILPNDWRANWYPNAIIDLNERFFIEKAIFKILVSYLYEYESIMDYAVLLGFNPKENIFAGTGISGPHYAPFIQINGYIDKLIFSISHRSKEVTEAFDNIYLQYPWAELNPDLKHEYWNSVSTMKLELQNIGNVEVSYREFGNTTGWARNSFDNTIYYTPINYDKEYEFEGKAEVKIGKFEYRSFIKHRSNYNLPKLYLYPMFPRLLLNNKLDISLPYNIDINIENEYNMDRKSHPYCYCPLSLPDYSLFSVMVGKKLGNVKLWCRVNNIMNVDYEIISGIQGYGRGIQGGFEIKI